jgi:hypothetical protein
MAETTVNAQLINWFQAVEIKIRPVTFALPPITPKKSRNMSQIFLVGIFFYGTMRFVSAWRRLLSAPRWRLRVRRLILAPESRGFVILLQ